MLLHQPVLGLASRVEGILLTKNLMRTARFYGRWASSYQGEREQGMRGSVLTRERAMIFELAQPCERDSVLDIGCGPGDFAQRLRPMVRRITGVDVSAGMLARARPHLDLALEGDLESLALEDRFDLIICCGVLDFVRLPSLGLSRIEKHLGRQGRAVLLVPALTPVGIGYAAARARHGIRVHLYSPARIQCEVAAAGLRCLRIERIGWASIIALLAR